MWQGWHVRDHLIAPPLAHNMTSVIGGDTYYRGSTRSFTSYASPHPEAMQRASAAKDQAEVANAMKKNLTVSSKIVENCPPSPVPEVLEDVKVLLQDLDDSPASIHEKELNPTVQSWMMVHGSLG
ncbi:uncharacterized protein ARMOST_06608 [Armillaria ostoyae]|uniref:Uncharacterized protein n=1 Tax=Armillaria ostoyae TaxID=47428 RepID=A0A284R3H9_ARMOS|nr:uncharacterized protein ARMOST_06608 [Armillaria ostoyae]